MRLLVLYDRDCRFCRAALAAFLTWDRRGELTPVALQEQRAEQLLGGMPEDERLESLRVIGADGVVHSGGGVLPVLFDSMPAGRGLGWIARRVRPLTDRAYEAVAGGRPALTKLLPERLIAAADRRIERRRGAG